MDLSDAGARFIGSFEGFSATLYDDPARHCTIGYGHLVHKGACNGSEPAEFRKGITHKRAAELLRADAAVAIAEIRRRVTVPLTQTRFDALVSFVYNVGTGAFARSTLLKKLNARDFAAVPDELQKWVRAGGKTLPGLVRRRRAEGKLFAEGSGDEEEAMTLEEKKKFDELWDRVNQVIRDKKALEKRVAQLEKKVK